MTQNPHAPPSQSCVSDLDQGRARNRFTKMADGKSEDSPKAFIHGNGGCPAGKEINI